MIDSFSDQNRSHKPINNFNKSFVFHAPQYAAVSGIFNVTTAIERIKQSYTLCQNRCASSLRVLMQTNRPANKCIIVPTMVPKLVLRTMELYWHWYRLLKFWYHHDNPCPCLMDRYYYGGYRCVFKITKQDLGILTLYYLMRYLINI